MAISLKHVFHSAKGDGPDPTRVQPSNWNTEHTLTLAKRKLLGRTTNSDGAAEEISMGTFGETLIGLAAITDLTALIFTPSTGDVKIRLATDVLSGWVRLNGKTIGDATSGGTERANADCAALFSHLWDNFSNTLCPVSTGRGVSGAADFAAHKTITLPDARGRGLFGLDDMGNAAAGRITATTATPNGTTLGASGGEQTHLLITAETPAHTHTFSDTSSSAGGHSHTFTTFNTGSAPSNAAQGTNNFTPAGTQATNAVAGHTHDVSGTTSSVGSGTAHNNMSPFLLVNMYVKL